MLKDSGKRIKSRIGRWNVKYSDDSSCLYRVRNDVFSLIAIGACLVFRLGKLTNHGSWLAARAVDGTGIGYRNFCGL